MACHEARAVSSTVMQTRGRASFGIGRPTDAWRVELDRPREIREATHVGDVRDVVAWVDARARAGQWAVLLLGYEAAPAFDTALAVRTVPAAERGPLPLTWAAVYDDEGPPARAPLDAPAGGPPPVPWAPVIDEARFGRDVADVLAHIAAGDSYQVNYTFPLTAPFEHDPWAWYRACAHQAAVPFPACIDTGRAVVMSLSPELFVERRGSRLRARPMKGTMRRGRWLDEDRRLAEALAASEKARAENVMIVDLLRNDLGRVADTGSVRVPELCTLERYPTVWQLTSGIEATLRPGTDLLSLLRAVFPCGSVTGAPKVRTMAIIAELESAPRGVYTGAICLLRPGGDLLASVPIRTAVFDRQTGHATFSVGAGITSDSTAVEEWAECLAKARVVRPPAVPAGVRLFETVRLEDGRAVRGTAHLTRLRQSAELFAWPAEPRALQAALDALAAAHAHGIWRARIHLDSHGRIETSAERFTPDARRWRVALAREAVDARSPLLFNKTTHREVYDRARAARPGMDDVLLWNARGELTEGTLANVVLELDGTRVTPPVACGLLPGVFRQELLTRGELVERVVPVGDLVRATRVWLINSLREWIEVDVVATPPGR